MVNVISKRCQEQGCMRIPCFNIEGKKTGVYCDAHKKDNMVSIVVKRRCKIKDCKETAYFNYENKKLYYV